MLTTTATTGADIRCDCDAPLRATAEVPTPFHRPGCQATFCSACGQPVEAHLLVDGRCLDCPDGRGDD